MMIIIIPILYIRKIRLGGFKVKVTQLRFKPISVWLQSLILLPLH